MTRIVAIVFAVGAALLPIPPARVLQAADAFRADSRQPDVRPPDWLPELVSLRSERSYRDRAAFDPGVPFAIRAASPKSDDVPLHFPVLRDDEQAYRLVGLGLPSLSLPRLPRFFGHIRTEYADDFDNQSRVGGRAHLRTGGMFDFDLETHYRVLERRLRGDDELWTGDFNVVYQLTKVQRVSFRTGIGIAWLHDEQDAKVGFNATWAADFYVKQPWLMSLELDLGRIESKSLLHARGTIGYVFGRIELYTGWDYYELGDRAFDGLIAGAGLWF